MDPATTHSAWTWHAGSWMDAPWTLWTAALVHLNAWHAVGNLLALLALCWLAWLWQLRSAVVVAAVVALPLAVLGLQAWPVITQYRGLSILTHALAATLVAWHLVRDASARRRPPATVLSLGAGLVAKLLVEQGWHRPLEYASAWGFQVALAAHLSGAAAGVVCGVAGSIGAAWFARRVRSRESPLPAP